MSTLVLENQKWEVVKETLLEGLQGAKRKNFQVILENTRKHLLDPRSRMNLMESATSGSTTAGNIASLNQIILPIIRRVMPTVIANEIVGVQPMVGPIGQISTLRVRYASTTSPTAPAPFNTPTTAGEEALSPFAIATAYSGSLSTGQADYTAALEGVPGRKLNIQILRQTIEAFSRKLSATYTFEAAQDAQSQYGLDLEQEIMAALAQEIVAEIDQEILGRVAAIAQTYATYDQSLVSGTATFVGDEHAAMAILINRAANDIGQRTRRGAGNWCVMSAASLTVLQSATTSAFARTTEGTFEAPTNTKFVGTLNGAMKVYVNSYAQDTDPVLLGYKGNETDAGIFYCPYIPLMSTGTVLDPSTLEPVMGFQTRYAVATLNNTADSLGNAGDYYKAIAVANLSFF